MDNEILKIHNEELTELKKHTKLAEQRLDVQREELNLHSKAINKHSEILSQHQSGFEINFKNLGKMEQRLNLEIKKL